MNRLDGGSSNDAIEENRVNISERLEEMRKSVIPSFWYSFFKSSWLIAMVIALLLIFTSGEDNGLLAGGSVTPARVVAIILIIYGVLADLLFAPLAKKSFMKKHPGYKVGTALKSKKPTKVATQCVSTVSLDKKKNNKKMSKAQKARLGTAAEGRNSK